MQNTSTELSDNTYYQIKQVLLQARAAVLTTVNTAMVQAYWHVGKLIVEAQSGEERASYGDDLIKRISTRLTQEFGKGFTATNLRYMRQFYLAFPIYHSLSDKLSWTHYRMLIKVSNPKAREYYAEEAAAGKWSVRQLERQIATQYYERLLSTHRDSEEVESLIKKNLPAKPDKFDPLTLVHDPFVLEFIGAKEDVIWQESELDIGVFSAKYDLILPSKEELSREIALTRQKFKLING